MRKNTFIYTISYNNITRYIGKSNNPRRRLYQHLNEKKNKHKYNWLQSIVKIGDMPVIEIIDEVPIEDWEYWEIYWIEQFRQWGFNLLNATYGGEGANGYVHTDESKERMSKSHRGKKLSNEHKEKISKSIKLKSKETPYYNRGEGNSRKPLDRDLLYQKYITDNMSMPELSKYFGVSEKKIFDELHRYNIKKEDGWWLESISEKYKKVVLQYDLNGNFLREWDGLVDIENDIGFNRSNIANCCRGIIKSSNGYIWRYKDEWIDLPSITKSESKTYQPVSKYDLEGNLLVKYNSITEASKDSGLKGYNIRICKEGKLKTHGGYIWK